MKEYFNEQIHLNMFEKDHNVNIKATISSIKDRPFPLNMKIVEAQPVKNDLKSLQR